MGRTAEEFAAEALEYNGADMAWIATATVFCWGIVPGVGLLYSGYTNRKNALANVWVSMMCMSVGSLSWMLLGYSLTYGTGNAFIGDATLFGHAGVLSAPIGGIPEMLYSLFQLVFSVATLAIFMGGASERARLSVIPVLAFCWPLLVYSPVAHWTWSPTGWLAVLGAYDFAGGSPVHIASGAGALAFSMYLSRPLFRSRTLAGRSLKVLVDHKPHNMMQLTLAYILIVSGWLAFDGGSTIALNLRSFNAMMTTQLSGAMGGFVWSLINFLYTGKWSLAGFVSGSVSGLVAITPGCGYVGLPASLLIGAIGGTACFYAARFKHTALAHRMRYSDPCDVFSCHCIGGIVGNLLTGIFTQAEIAATDGASAINGGWLDGYYRQLGIQLADCVAVTAYAFVVTYVLVALIDCIPGLEVLATDEDIIAGLDMAGAGESFGDEQWRDEAEWHPFLGNTQASSDHSGDREEKDGVKTSVGAAV